MIAGPPNPARRLRLAALCAAGLPLLLGSCSSSPEMKGLPARLPEIALSGSTATPPHSMASYEYPFDSGGSYVTDWAAEGERRAGRSARATRGDVQKWSGSHGGSASKSSRTSGTSAASKTKSKTTGGTRYTVKKGDTLGAIAARNRTSVKALKSANGLKSDLIRVGQTLRIPR